MDTEIQNPIVQVVQNNQLINGRYEMNLIERRVFLKMISLIRPDDSDFKDFYLSVKELAEDIGTSAKSVYADLQRATESMIKRVVKIREKDRVIQVGLISSATYYEKKGILQIRFDPSLKPYLLQLKNNFTVYGLQHALKFKSFYSLRIYEMLKQFQSTGHRFILLEDLRFSLGLEEGEYDKYGHLKSRILNHAQKELSKSDIPFSFKEVKSGKKVIAIDFRFEANTKQDDTLLLIESDGKNKTRVAETLLSLGLSEKQSKTIMAKLSDQEIFKTAYDINLQVSNGKINNKAAYAYKVFMSKI
jgi:plasmid replication initiation protein